MLLHVSNMLGRQTGFVHCGIKYALLAVFLHGSAMLGMQSEAVQCDADQDLLAVDAELPPDASATHQGNPCGLTRACLHRHSVPTPGCCCGRTVQPWCSASCARRSYSSAFLCSSAGTISNTLQPASTGFMCA